MINLNTQSTIFLPLDPKAKQRFDQFSNAVFYEKACKVAAVVLGIFSALIAFPLIRYFLNKADQYAQQRNELFDHVLRDINKDLMRTGKIFIDDQEFSKKTFNATSLKPADETWSEKDIRTQFRVAQKVKRVLDKRFSETQVFMLLSNCMQGIYVPVVQESWKIAGDAPSMEGVVNMPKTTGSQEYRIETRDNHPIVSTSVHDQVLALDTQTDLVVRPFVADAIRDVQTSLVFDTKTATFTLTEDPTYDASNEHYDLPLETRAREVTNAMAAAMHRVEDL